MSGAPLFPLAQRVHGPGARAGRPVPSLPSCRGLARGQRSPSGAIATGPAPPAMVPTPRFPQTPRSSPGMGIGPRSSPGSSRTLRSFLRSRFRARRCCECWGGPASVPLPTSTGRGRPRQPQICGSQQPQRSLATFSFLRSWVFSPRSTQSQALALHYPCWQLLILLPLPVPSPSGAQGRTHACEGGSRG